VRNEILVLAEHRQGNLRDISLEMLAQATRLAGSLGGEVVTLLLGSSVGHLAATLTRHSDKVLYSDDARFEHFSSDAYRRVLADVILARKPALVMIAHSAQGADLAPALAVEIELPLTTDVISIAHDEGTLKATRQMFQGKVNADYSLATDRTQLITVREGSFMIAPRTEPGLIEDIVVPVTPDNGYKKFVEYLEAQTGAVDITKSAILVSVGRGIKEQKNLAIIEELAAALNADICGSRVAIDAGWLPQDRQVGITGKVVKPKVYIAIGISGSFQHLAGMSGAKTIVAINKDPNAPIFSVADFAIVDDLFKVVPKLTQKIKSIREQS